MSHIKRSSIYGWKERARAFSSNRVAINVKHYYYLPACIGFGYHQTTRPIPTDDTGFVYAPVQHHKLFDNHKTLMVHNRMQSWRCAMFREAYHACISISSHDYRQRPTTQMYGITFYLLDVAGRLPGISLYRENHIELRWRRRNKKSYAVLSSFMMITCCTLSVYRIAQIVSVIR